MYDRFDDHATSSFAAGDSLEPTEELVLADMDDAPTEDQGSEARRLRRHRPRDRGPALAVSAGEILSTSLPINARAAYEAFCDIDSCPRWVPVVSSVRVLSWTPAGRAKRAAFLARLQNGSIGYTLHYRYSESACTVSWGTVAESMTLVAGRAQFIPLGDRATLMQYQLSLELPEEALPPWDDPFFSGHAASVVMNDFREYVTRLHRS